MKDTVLEFSRRAFGKVNLTLRITGRRPDGYHEVSTIMIPVQLHDVLTFRPGGEGLSVVCPALPGLLPKDNLVMKAVQAVFDVSGCRLNLHIQVDKAIPEGGGMGGGSSDAAAALLVVNSMIPQESRLRPGRLLKVAASIGADVPFFLGCNSVPPAWSAAWCSGTGGDVHPLPDPKQFHLVLAIPSFQVNTAQAYKDWDEVNPGLRPQQEWREQDVVSALSSGNASALAQLLVNDLEEPVAMRHPEIEAVKQSLIHSGALGASMTGSGSAVFGICRSPEHAEEVKLEMEARASELGLRSVVVLRTGCED
ncbi:MAG: 4-(cytidine 5'-diphospho)-2-C-methyl-D-erythritol kinase [Bacillota bacterium]